MWKIRNAIKMLSIRHKYEENEMFVCKQCHERDRVTTKCKEDYEKHLVSVVGKCSICGKHTADLRWCISYKHMRKDNGQEAYEQKVR